jgi:cell division protein FtsB
MSTSDIIIMLAIIGAIAYDQYIKLQVKKENVKLRLKQQSSKSDEENQATINELKQRIEVLEKIVTDEKYSLKDEINKLSKVS